MPSKLHNFITELQESDKPTKLRWLVALTAASMVIVIALWIVYINITIQGLGTPQQQKEQSEFSATLKNGVMILSKSAGTTVSAAIGRMRALFARTNSITIEQANINYIVNDLEAISPKRLP